MNFISNKISLIVIFVTVLACVDIDNEENNTQQLGQDQSDFDLSVLFKYFDESVNVTLGVPFIRTSVDHGTAFDIAFKNIASAKNLLNAIFYAIKMSNLQ